MGACAGTFARTGPSPASACPINFGSPEFELAYRAAVAGEAPPATQGLPRQGA
jgi:hypothetical protein